MSNSQAVRTRHPKSITRANILAKAYEMYLANEIDHGDERLSAVLDRLGYTTGAGYQIWANQAAFREELKVYVAENIDYAKLEMVEAKRAALMERNPEFPLFVRCSGDIYFESFIGKEDFYLSLRFFAMSGDRPEPITNALSGAYHQSSWAVGARFADVLKFKEHRLRDCFEMEDLTAAVTALIEGYALRYRVDPERASRKVQFEGEEHYAFSIAFCGLIFQFIEPDPSPSS